MAALVLRAAQLGDGRRPDSRCAWFDAGRSCRCSDSAAPTGPTFGHERALRDPRRSSRVRRAVRIRIDAFAERWRDLVDRAHAFVQRGGDDRVPARDIGGTGVGKDPASRGDRAARRPGRGLQRGLRPRRSSGSPLPTRRARCCSTSPTTTSHPTRSTWPRSSPCSALDTGGAARRHSASARAPTSRRGTSRHSVRRRSPALAPCQTPCCQGRCGSS